jgi:glutamine synthetase
MASAKDVLKQIKDEEIEWVDLRFTDPKGKWQHLTMDADDDHLLRHRRAFLG